MQERHFWRKTDGSAQRVGNRSVWSLGEERVKESTLYSAAIGFLVSKCIIALVRLFLAAKALNTRRLLREGCLAFLRFATNLCHNDQLMLLYIYMPSARHTYIRAFFCQIHSQLLLRYLTNCETPSHHIKYQNSSLCLLSGSSVRAVKATYHHLQRVKIKPLYKFSFYNKTPKKSSYFYFFIIVNSRG